MVIVSRDHTQLHTHTHTHTLIGTPRYKGSTSRGDLYLYNTQHSPETDKNGRGGVRTRNLSKRATADLLLRPRDHRDPLQYPV
jgi:hypothetical protein